MAHALAAIPGPAILAMVDPGAVPPAPYPITPVSTEIPYPKPVRSVPRSWAAYVQLCATLPGAVRDAKLTAWVAEELQRRAEVLPTVMRSPSGLTPYPWQVEAAQRFARLGQAMLSDDPGTGKTISAILSILARQDAPQGGDALPAVVVAPASVCAAWVKAWAAWAPDVEVARYHGPKRARYLDGSRTAEVLVMSYDVMRLDHTKLRDWLHPKGSAPCGTLVLDEHHLIKNAGSARGRAALALGVHAACKIVLSGTPITHHPGDLWPALNVLEPLAWPSSVRFEDRYCEKVMEDYQEKIVGLAPARAVEFSVALLGVQRRVAKADALDLPPKVYSTREVTLPPEWRKAYNGMRDQMLADLPETLDQMAVMSVLAQLIRLQQLAAAPADVWSVHEWDEKMGQDVERQKVKLKGPSWKVEALLEILAERPDQQVLVFSPSRQVIQLCEDALTEEAIGYATLVGGQAAGTREREVEAFQRGDRRVMLATTQAGGVGVTLTAASTVVFLGRPFSLVEALQAEDRAHRIGSERHESIEIIDVLAEDTVDQAVRSVLRGKAATLAEVLRDPRVAAEVLGGREVKAS